MPISETDLASLRGRHIVVTGQVGLNKGAWLKEAAALLRERTGVEVVVYDVGALMYAADPTITYPNILRLDRGRLMTLRRLVMERILQECKDHPERVVILNTHATFRWHHGLFEGLDIDHLQEFKADLYVTLVDNLDALWGRLQGDHNTKADLRDLMAWREEEIMATRIYAAAAGCKRKPLIIGRGRSGTTMDAFVKLAINPGARKIYPSFPMTHVMDQPEVQKQIDAFKAALAVDYITFDPADVDEWGLILAARAAKPDQTHIEGRCDGKIIELPVADVLALDRHFSEQIADRDFRLIDQSDEIVTFYPVLPTGYPAISTGAERELEHAIRNSKDVHVVWPCQRYPSPFVTVNADHTHPMLDAYLKNLRERTSKKAA